MERRKQALIVGRFQPLCKNHVALFEEAKRHAKHVLVAVGQPNYAIAKETMDAHEYSTYELRYIFDFERVKEWVDMALGEYPHTVVEVRDIFAPSLYASHVVHMFEINGVDVSDDCIVLGENKETYRCFSDFGFDIGVTDALANYHATDVRREILKTGHSSRLFADLTDLEKKLIISTERLKNRLESGAHTVHRGHVHLVREPFGGHLYDVVVSMDAAVVMYVDDDDHVWFCRQYRVPMRKELLELPAETLDKPGLSALEHAVSGLAEECGISVDASLFEHVGCVGSSEGHDTEMVHLFVAHGPHQQVGQSLDEHEYITVERIPFEEAYGRMLSGEITGAKSRILLQHEYIRRLEGGRNGTQS